MSFLRPIGCRQGVCLRAGQTPSAKPYHGYKGLNWHVPPLITSFFEYTAPVASDVGPGTRHNVCPESQGSRSPRTGEETAVPDRVGPNERSHSDSVTSFVLSGSVTGSKVRGIHQLVQNA